MREIAPNGELVVGRHWIKQYEPSSSVTLLGERVSDSKPHKKYNKIITPTIFYPKKWSKHDDWNPIYTLVYTMMITLFCFEFLSVTLKITNSSMTKWSVNWRFCHPMFGSFAFSCCKHIIIFFRRLDCMFSSFSQRTKKMKVNRRTCGVINEVFERWREWETVRFFPLTLACAWTEVRSYSDHGVMPQMRPLKGPGFFTN